MSNKSFAASVPPADCFLPLAFEKLLRFIQPTLFSSVFVCWRCLDGIDTRLHRTGSFLVIAEARMGAPHQIETFRIVLTTIEKPLQRIARVGILSGCDICRANLAPDFVLSVELIARHDLFEIRNRLSQTPL